MNEYNISDYGIFSDAVQTTNTCSNSVTTAKDGVTACKTVVGIEGGVNPFSLKRHVPTFTNKSLYVDPKTKKLSVDIKVTAN